MPSRFDPRQEPKVNDLLKPFSGATHAPFVQEADLREARLVTDALPQLDFPINSKGELIDKLEKSGKKIEIEGITIDPASMVHRVPSSYFPLVSMENFLEKIAELIRNNRTKVDPVTELPKIKRQLPEMRYPITSVDELVQQLGPERPYKYGRATILPRQIARRISVDIFPIESQEDFDRKIAHLIVNKPLVVGH